MAYSPFSFLLALAAASAAAFLFAARVAAAFFAAAERAAETGAQEQMEKKKRESGRIPLRERRRSGTGRSGRALRVDVALAAYELAFTHPETGESMIFQQNASGVFFRQFQMPGQQ